MKSITVSKEVFEQMAQDLKTLRKSQIYKRLLEFEKNISQSRKFSRTDLGF